MGYSLLIVDDERHIREAILISCDWAGLGIGDIRTARDGREALAMLEERPADILLSDIVMPEIDGLELCDRVHRQFPHTLLYLLTGHNDFEYARTALRSGVGDYILKPVDGEELTAAMADAAEKLTRRLARRQQITRLEEEWDDALPQEVRRALRAFAEDALSDWASLPAEERTGGRPACANPTIQQVLDYLEEHIADEELSLGMIAETRLFLNAHYLGKLFKKEMGVKFSTYLLDRRIKQAVRFIRENPGAKVYEIAQAAGFGDNPSYFSALFRKVTGRSPTEFRE